MKNIEIVFRGEVSPPDPPKTHIQFGRCDKCKSVLKGETTDWWRIVVKCPVCNEFVVLLHSSNVWDKNRRNPYVDARPKLLLEMSPLEKQEIEKLEASGNKEHFRYKEFIRMIMTEAEKTP